MSNQIKTCKVAIYADVTKLKFHPDNPRTIKEDRLAALKESIIQRGFYQPILVWKKNSIVLAGNHRLMAVQELIKEGWEFITPDGKLNHLPVVIEDVSKDEAMAILLETNNTYAEWVEDKLSAALKDMEERGHSILSVGFTQAEVDGLLTKAIKEADDILGKHGSLPAGEPPAPPKLSDEQKAEENMGFEALMLPTDSYKALKHLLETISLEISPAARPSPGLLGIAAQALVRAAEDLELVEHIAINMGAEDDAPDH